MAWPHLVQDLPTAEAPQLLQNLPVTAAPHEGHRTDMRSPKSMLGQESDGADRVGQVWDKNYREYFTRSSSLLHTQTFRGRLETVADAAVDLVPGREQPPLAAGDQIYGMSSPSQLVRLMAASTGPVSARKPPLPSRPSQAVGLMPSWKDWSVPVRSTELYWV
jgi:hypothetical protein